MLVIFRRKNLKKVGKLRAPWKIMSMEITSTDCTYNQTTGLSYLYTDPSEISPFWYVTVFLRPKNRKFWDKERLVASARGFERYVQPEFQRTTQNKNILIFEKFDIQWWSAYSYDSANQYNFLAIPIVRISKNSHIRIYGQSIRSVKRL